MRQIDGSARALRRAAVRAGAARRFDGRGDGDDDERRDDGRAARGSEDLGRHRWRGHGDGKGDIARVIPMKTDCGVGARDDGDGYFERDTGFV